MASISSVITGGFGTPGSAYLVITEGFGTAGVTPPTPDVSVTPTLGGVRFDKRRRGKVVRFSDFETREAYEAAIRQAIPIPRPQVVESAEDLDEEDFIIVNLLGLLND